MNAAQIWRTDQGKHTVFLQIELRKEDFASESDLEVALVTQSLISAAIEFLKKNNNTGFSRHQI